MELFLPNMSQSEMLIHFIIFIVNFSLLFLSKPIIYFIDPDPDQDHKVTQKLFVTINLLFLILHIADIVLMAIDINYQNMFIKLAYSALSLYLSIFVYKLGNRYFRRKFGKSKIFEETTVYFDSYSSRVVEIIFLVVVFLLTTYSIIKIWEMDSLLETTGIFGITIGFLALTSSVWAPDILSGLIILNSNILEDGDVVVIDGYNDEYIIHKVSFIYTILYDIRNNHRTFIRNKRFIESKIDNLSRLASTEGIRKSITFKIGYPELSDDNKNTRIDNLLEFRSGIDKLFSGANQLALKTTGLPIKKEKPFEWFLTSTDDYSLVYTLYIYLEPVPNTKITSVARKHLLSSLFSINELVLESSANVGLELKTPDLISLNHSGVST